MTKTEAAIVRAAMQWAESRMKIGVRKTFMAHVRCIHSLIKACAAHAKAKRRRK